MSQSLSGQNTAPAWWCVMYGHAWTWYDTGTGSTSPASGAVCARCGAAIR